MVLKMIYDAKFFDQVFERRGHDATKWDYPLFVKDNKDIVPMWVADMDFKTAPQITEALEKRARDGQETGTSCIRLLQDSSGLLRWYR